MIPSLRGAPVLLAAFVYVLAGWLPWGDAAAAPAAVRPTPAGDATALVGADIHIGDGATTIDDGIVVIRGDRIVHVGGPDTRAAIPPAATIVELTGKRLTPGLIAAHTPLGLTEISLESETRDIGRDVEDPLRAAYDVSAAVNADSSLIPIQLVDGITNAAVTPFGGLVSGRVAWIDLLPGAHRDIVARPRIAMVSNLGQTYAGSRAATLAKLREILDDARFYRTRRGAYDRRQTRDLSGHRLDLEALGPVLDGTMPLIVSAHRVSDMLAVVDLAREQKLDVVIVGGAQAWKIADVLADANIEVIVQPSENLPGGFDRLGSRLDNAALLHAAGVQVGIATLGEAHNVRNVTQEAGIAVAYGLPHEAALSAVTRNIARAYGMQSDYGTVAVGKVANLVIWDGDPFELSNVPSAVWVRGRKAEAISRQRSLTERYKDLSSYR